MKAEILEKLDSFEEQFHSLLLQVIRLKQQIINSNSENYEKEDTLLFEDFNAMISDMKSHPYPIESSDNPKRLRIGFECRKTGKRWEMGLIDFAKSGFDLSLPEKQIRNSILMEVNENIRESHRPSYGEIE